MLEVHNFAKLLESAGNFCQTTNMFKNYYLKAVKEVFLKFISMYRISLLNNVLVVFQYLQHIVEVPILASNQKGCHATLKYG